MKASRIAKRIFIGFILVLVLVILGRILLLEDDSLLSELYSTEAAEVAYGELGKTAFKTHKIPTSLAPDGYYSANGLIFVESEGELQVTSRYNDSLYNYLSAPADAEFTWTLVDKANEVTYEGKILETGKKYMYNYTKLSFSDVEIEEDSELYLFMHYEDKYPEETTEGLLLHNPVTDFKRYRLSKAEKGLFE